MQHHPVGAACLFVADRGNDTHKYIARNTPTQHQRVRVFLSRREAVATTLAGTVRRTVKDNTKANVPLKEPETESARLICVSESGARHAGTYK